MNRAERYPGFWRLLSNRTTVRLARHRRAQAVASVVGAFLRKAFRDNLTGLSGMLAYQLVLSLIGLAFVALFVASRLLQSPGLDVSLAGSFQRVFPRADAQVITNTLVSIRTIAPGIGAVGALAGLWLASTVWSAFDAAFSQIYRLPRRAWAKQKRFALSMVVVSLGFSAVSLFGPFAQSLVAAGAKALPFGLAAVNTLAFWLTVILGVALEFLILCLIYRAVPNRPVPWRAVWPGALLATAATTAIAFCFPVYLSLSAVAHIASQFGLALIALVWFFALAMAILGGAVANAMRLGSHLSR